MSEGFLGRWSRRKIDVREGKVLEQPVGAPLADTPALAVPVPVPARDGSGEVAPTPAVEQSAAAAPAEIPPPTLDDAAALTPESDFKPFMARNVPPDVKNAAVKKLFADPRYNIQDGMDTYIGDYSKSDPIPESMLRQMASAKFLNLFEEKEEEPADAAPAAGGQGRARDDADAAPAQSVAQSYAEPDIASETPPDTTHADHPDLRLQPDDAAAGREPGRGPA